jgi:hypothetical protein
VGKRHQAAGRHAAPYGPPQHCSMFANTHEILYTSTGSLAYPHGWVRLRAIMGTRSTDITRTCMCVSSHVGPCSTTLPAPASTHELRLTSPGLREAFSTHDPLVRGEVI